MNNKVNYLLISTLIFYIFSCGPSNGEIARREKFVADSIQTVKDNIAKQIEEERILKLEKEYLENVEEGSILISNKFRQRIEKVDKQIRIAKSDLDRIYEFQIGRSMDSKREQIRRQNRKIMNLESEQKALKDGAELAKLDRSFDFQNTPTGTVEHIIYAAKNKDYSNLVFLMDPYGEFNNNVMNLCLVNFMSREDSDHFNENFENSRIISESNYSSDSAMVEIAIGPNSDRLEKINLVKRLDKWYLSSI